MLLTTHSVACRPAGWRRRRSRGRITAGGAAPARDQESAARPGRHDPRGRMVTRSSLPRPPACRGGPSGARRAGKWSLSKLGASTASWRSRPKPAWARRTEGPLVLGVPPGSPKASGARRRQGQRRAQDGPRPSAGAQRARPAPPPARASGRAYQAEPSRDDRRPLQPAALRSPRTRLPYRSTTSTSQCRRRSAPRTPPARRPRRPAGRARPRQAGVRPAVDRCAAPRRLVPTRAGGLFFQPISRRTRRRRGRR